jgi:CHAT domain-containing protein/Flp pilus assembly protein TadD
MNSIRVFIVGLFICFNSFLESQELKRSQWKSLYKEGASQLEMDSLSNAFTVLKKALFIASKYHNNKTKYGKSLLAFCEANLKLKTSQTIDSLRLIDNILHYSKTLSPSKRLSFSRDIQRLGELSLNQGLISNAIQLFNERVDVLRQTGDTINMDYAIASNGLGRSYMKSLKNYDKAKENFEKALKIVKNNPSEKSLENNILTDLVDVYLRLNKNEKAHKLAEKLLYNIESQNGTKHEDYTNKLNKLGEIYLNNGVLDKAALFENRAIEIFKSQNDQESLGYLLANYLLGRIEKENNNYEESIEAYKKVQKVFIDKEFTDLDNYAIVLGNIGLCYDRLGDYKKALDYCSRALQVKGIKPNTKSTRLMDKGYFYENIGRFDEAHAAYDKALISMGSSLGKEHQEYAKLLNNIGKLYFEEENYTLALEYYLQALKTVEVEEGERWHPFYSYMLNDYAMALFQLERVNEAEELMLKNIAYFERNNLPKDEDYYNRIHSLAKLYNLTEQYAKAKSLIDKATENIQLILGSDHEDYGQFLKTKSATYLGLNDIESAVSFLKASNEVLLRQVDNIFRFSSEVEKKAFLEMISETFNYFQSVLYSQNLENKKLIVLNLNNQLILKGLLLNNSKGLFLDLKALNDQTINGKIREYKNLKNVLARVLSKPMSKRILNVDSLKQRINNSEANLVRIHAKNFKNSRTFLKNWKDIQSHMEDTDVAVEFSHFNYVEKGSKTNRVQYVAYIFDSSDVLPQVVPLFNENELNEVISHKNIDQIYNSIETYNLIWKPIDSLISNYKTIYYSPSGKLNQIALAALKKNNEPIIAKHNLIQLSSTFNIDDVKEKLSIESAVLLGGINYDYVGEENGDELALKYKESVGNDFLFTQTRGTKNRGESWTYLEGTITEINSLSEILGETSIDVTVLIGDNASEEAVKKLEGSSPSLMHIATHGYFFESNDSKVRNPSQLSLEDQYRLSDDPLLRSGLILAGANYTWKNSQKPKNKVEDGILTALEISNMDFLNTELVVLSACDTGLGDIEGSEGVYGLQRAFKMAGVDKLIMSLWEVPDTETSEFMISFYDFWQNGKSVREAFLQTQRIMSKKYTNTPSKWAAFVLFE